MKLRLFLFIIILAITGCSHIGLQQNSASQNTVKTELLYNSFLAGAAPNAAQLNLFFNRMPKGGDIHHHFSGSIYAEHYLDWVESAGFLINKHSFTVIKPADAAYKTEAAVTVKQLRADPILYRKLLICWSDKDFHNHYHQQLPPDINFFSTFGYFGPVSKNYKEGLRILKNQALAENVGYIETMLSSVDYSGQDNSFDENIRKTSSRQENEKLFGELFSKLELDEKIPVKIEELAHDIETAHRGIDDDRFLMRYQIYAHRNGTPSSVFSSLYAAFRASQKIKLLVGVNFVGPEHGLTACTDYKLHMQMISYLREKFPRVNLALHAGELTLGIVPPQDLRFHINEALNTAGAARIGHALTLPYEERSLELLKAIKEKAAVEINFTSNEFILGVKDNEHPYLIYSAYGIPLVISSDDPGVSRNSLAAEYVLLAKRYRPCYQTVKKYAYNSIKYSFLSAEEKKSITRRLDADFEKFEAETANYYDLLFK